ncbi:uncharacterized protein LOC143290334 [Babylonia areolata]|uniref:uncharacterized protein LOC143290334 n=1 Tax=Babylonia areolata TaxID=304850 RepID=UPI003FD27B5C
MVCVLRFYVTLDRWARERSGPVLTIYLGPLTRNSKALDNLRNSINDQEQHGRQWNIRVFGVREAQGQETAEDCLKKCLSIFTEKLEVPVSVSDIDIAHRTGKVGAGGGRPRPIIVRFMSRGKRGQVLTARRKLKQTGITVGEDLTQTNYRLLKKLLKAQRVASRDGVM